MILKFDITREMIDGLDSESLYQLASQSLGLLAARLAAKASDGGDPVVSGAAVQALNARKILTLGEHVKFALGLTDFCEVASSANCCNSR